MQDYYFRVKTTDRDEMRRLLRELNIIRVRDGEIVPFREGDAWLDIGRLDNWQNPGAFLRDPVSNEPYWHYNLRTTINVRGRIRNAVLEGNPDAIALDSQKGRWFSRVTNDESDTPEMPKVVWL